MVPPDAPPALDATPDRRFVAPDHPALRQEATYTAWIDEHVRYADLDLNGHANNVAYAIFFEQARATLLGGYGLVDPAAGRTVVLARIAIDYLAEMPAGAKFRTGIALLRVGSASLLSAAGVFWQGRCMAVSTAVNVAFDSRTRRAIPFPAPVAERLRTTLVSLP